MIRNDCRYTEEHEWAKKEDDGKIRGGITEYAVEQLGDIVLVELPEVGDSVSGGEPCGTIESVKAVTDLFAPVTGVVAEINELLLDEPNQVNEDPYGKGWMILVEPERTDSFERLMSAEKYEKLVREETE